jgi:hypothetical protein
VFSLDLKEEKLEALDSLRHDLGKYLRMPIAFLPSESSAKEVREALVMALHQTKSQGGRYESAREIWEAFVAKNAQNLEEIQEYLVLVDVVERAFRWERALEDEELLDQSAITRDLGEVYSQITRLIGEVSDA